VSEIDDDNPLDLVEADALIAELAKRYDSLVVVALRDMSEEEEGTRCWYFGGQMTCLGMLTGTQARLLNEHVNGGEIGPA